MPAPPRHSKASVHQHGLSGAEAKLTERQPECGLRISTSERFGGLGIGFGRDGGGDSIVLPSASILVRDGEKLLLRAASVATLRYVQKRLQLGEISHIGAIWLTPTEQPPRKLSGKMTVQLSDLERGAGASTEGESRAE